MSNDQKHKVPNAEDMSGTCRRCGTYSHFRPIGGYASPTTPKPKEERMIKFSCDYCDKVTVVIERYDSPRWSVYGVWPLADSEVPDYVPDEVDELYREAQLCLSAQCYRAAVAMTRAAIDAAVTDKGGKGKWLHDRIQSLRGTLRDQLIDVADELKVGGNDAAHDFNQKWSEEEASERFRFLEEVLRELYETPLRIKNVKQLAKSRQPVSAP